MPPARTGWILALALAVLLAFAGGLWLGRDAGHAADGLPPTVADRAPAGAGTDPALLAALEDLAAEVRALVGRLDRAERTGAPRPGSSEPGRAPAGEAPAEPDDLAAALGELVALLRARGTPGRAAEPLLVPRGTTRTDQLAALPDPGDDGEDLSRMHHFWSYQDVLDAYGRPSTISPLANGMRWHYELPERGSLVFTFVDGMVVTVYD